MAIGSALSIARSGLTAIGEAMNVTGNNIANVNTTAFKGQRSEFADLLGSQTGLGNPDPLGVEILGTSTDLSQGSLQETGQATDLAIRGSGYFVVRDGAANAYTRAGNFTVDNTGTLTTQTGLAVQGFQLDANGNIVGAPVDVSFGAATSAPVATTAVDVKNNIDASASVISGGFVNTDFKAAYASSNFTTTVKVFDSLGTSHDVTLFFTKTAANAWDVNVGVNAADTGGTAGALNSLGAYNLTFNNDGSLDSVTGGPTAITGLADGAADMSFTLNFGTPNPGLATPGAGRDGLTQNAGTSNAAASQDGFAAGQLAGVSVDPNGVVTGVFDNGQSKALYRLAMANFQAPEGLSQLGAGLYRESAASGVAAIGTANGGGVGRIASQALERSNVDLASEFVNLITYERSFQANSRVITTSDTLLNELINIVR